MKSEESTTDRNLLQLLAIESHLTERKKSELKKVGKTILLSLLLSIATITAISPLRFENQSSIVILLSTPAILLTAWYGNILTGVLTTVLITLGIDFFTISPVHSFLLPSSQELIPLGLFITHGMTASFIIERIKNTDELKEYKNREKKYLEFILQQKNMYAKAREEIKARDEFLSIASHELRTPLTSMLLQIQTILHDIRNVSLANFSVENLMRMLMSAEQQTNRLSKMINDLLNTSLITTGKLHLEKERVNLSHLIKAVIDDFSEKLKKENITIATKTDDTIYGHWDKLRIEQVLTNLLSNAIKYGNRKPIHLITEKKNNKAIIYIEDEGIGIPQDLQDKIFARFERAVSNKQFEGLGVGLYITSQIIKEHGGKISVKSRPHHGSVFCIELPLSETFSLPQQLKSFS